MPIAAALTLAAAALTADARIDRVQLSVRLDPATHRADVKAYFGITGGGGELALRLHAAAESIDFPQPPPGAIFRIERATETGRDHHLIRITLPPDSAPGHAPAPASAPAPGSVTIAYSAVFEQDVEAGEVEGQIHNKSVSAHIGDNGIFLSDGAAWHPQWVDEHGRPRLMRISITVEPLEGWTIVASGEPAAHLRTITDPVWGWVTPRPVDGMAVVGNRHVIAGASHDTAHGPVDIVMHTTAEHESLAPMFIDAAKSYLDLYVPLLGPFPYRRFSIVENFFSSGFAYPGFTVLGPQVVGMAPRSLAPGYLDHELIHNWWGNGVYVSPDDGNWCEALTTYCANYYRRIADEGEDAGRDWRRGTLMKLSTDPGTLDNGPLDAFGRDQHPGVDRFVGYDKGAFVFSMLEGGGPYADVTDSRAAMFRALKRFAAENMGQFAGWDDLRAAFEAEFGPPLGGYFDRWIRRHTLPESAIVTEPEGLAALNRSFGARIDLTHIRSGEKNGRRWIEVDPEFRLYRTLPAAHLVPTIAGTQGPGGVRVITEEKRAEVQSYLPRLDARETGENLILIGAGAVAGHAAMIGRGGDPIEVSAGSFTVAGTTYDQPAQAVLHTIHHPSRPGRYVTIFHSNGEIGWSRLRLIGFYTRDTTIIWDGEQVIARRAYEPDRRFWPED